ncbi:hypothetical protein KUTeg_003491 [Tegillarca granosa]|uniref:AAA+ ATPase domain-containing protein n=1 Tax=Tegillarca granosa TaxID=220873 RepID=A0ABQ9FQ61_TEGGR|nr:hypothetical protein KUTeg_003491 [Tegillarca granosa]
MTYDVLERNVGSVVLLVGLCEQVAKSLKMSRLLAVSIDELKDQIEQERQQKLLDEADRITAEIHRTLLHWLKLWDYVVFGKELNIKNKDKKKQNKDNKKKKYQPEVMDELDKYNRPVQKIALLNGPPGLGKTTLAHVLAEHAGYSTVEINASDDRSAEVFKNKLESATQMKAVLGDDPRPNCLIIDEIDGAPLRTDEPIGQKKKKQQGGLLLRPIICICNDQYVPALRQLRQCALIVNFPPTEPAKLAGRLYEVCSHSDEVDFEVIRFEQLKADMNTLLALCEKTDNDIRSCLNTLQFIQRKKKELSLKSIQMSNVGSKDSNKSLFSLWYDVFSMPRQKSVVHVITCRFHNIVRSAHASGDYEKIIQGLCLEKYVIPNIVWGSTLIYKNMNMASDWICFTDELYQYINHMQDYCLMPYIPYVVATFHLLYASNQRPKVQYPHAQYEALFGLIVFDKCSIIYNYTSPQTEMLPSTRKYLNEQCAVLEVLPPLMDIIQPTLRPKSRLTVVYKLRFPIADQLSELGKTWMRLLDFLIQLEKMRRTESASGTIVQKPEPSHKQKLTAKPITEEEKPIKDFFGRVIKKKTPEPKQKKVEKKNVLTTDIWFHFKEGYSNAVRRNIHLALLVQQDYNPRKAETLKMKF